MPGSDEPLNPEEELAALQTVLGEALPAYGYMLRLDQWDQAEMWLEQLAEYWRTAAEINRLEERGDELLSSDAVELMAALESSLTPAGLAARPAAAQAPPALGQAGYATAAGRTGRAGDGRGGGLQAVAP
jgi:hypothetical protein